MEIRRGPQQPRLKHVVTQETCVCFCLQQWHNAWRGLPHADRGRILQLQWSWRQYSRSVGPSRLLRIHGRLEVTRCITDGAPDFVSQVMIIDCGYQWFQEERITMVVYFVKSWFRVHLTAFYSPADNPNALIVLPFQVHHAPPWVSLNIKVC